MPQRRPPTDSEPLDPTPEQLTAADRYFQAIGLADSRAIGMLFGDLPNWLPEPIQPRIRRAISSLRAAGQSDERICELVALARDARLETVPGAVKDVYDFFNSVNELAHVQWALSLEKASALRELAGSRAAKDYQRSKQGNEALYGTDADRLRRDRDICSQAAALRDRNKSLGANAIASQLAPVFGLSIGHIKRILRSGK